MEPRNGNVYDGQKTKNRLHWGSCFSSQEGRSFRSLLHLKSPFFNRTKVVPGKDSEGKGDPAPASTLANVETIDKKNKQPVVAEERSQSALVDDDGHEEHENHIKLIDVQPVCDMPSSSNPGAKIADQTDTKFQCFKIFDTVTDCLGHHYATRAVKKPSKYWLKRIQHEWNILERNLPETIFVRAYEDRMDLLRAVIIGPAGTPYHEGLFFFDIQFQEDYPFSPPKVHYHSFGVRLNPNLYGSGYVCLSLLNTWHGSKHEKWDPKMSTILQVLVSIQGLVLNEKPYFNEPSLFSKANTKRGEENSLSYNRQAFLLSSWVILKVLQNPPKHFEDFVAAHFCKQGCFILAAWKAYMRGAHIGSVRADGAIDTNGDNKACSSKFCDTLARYIDTFDKALKAITAKGANS